MKLATVEKKNGERDGQLFVVDQKSGRAVQVDDGRISSLIHAVENWSYAEPILRGLAAELSSGKTSDSVELGSLKFKSPLPRTYGFLDGSAFLPHVRRVRKSRGAEMPPELEEIPLMYQGISDDFFDPLGELVIADESFGYDMEAELAVIVDDVPLGTSATDALSHIKLIILLNDVSLRNLIPAELGRGFGFLQGKPSSSCGPYAVTLDELGALWKDGRAHLNVRTELNGQLLGNLNSAEMHFTFGKLIEHAARTRRLSAGTIVGSGTISNESEDAGVGCLVERRVIEIIKDGTATTPYLKRGDEFKIEASLDGQSVFGAIKHRCV